MEDLFEEMVYNGKKPINEEILFEHVRKSIVVFRCEGINLPESDKQRQPNCNDASMYSFELKFKFSDSSQCGNLNNAFSDLESWDTLSDWSNTRNDVDIYDEIIDSRLLFDGPGHYLCLAFSEEGIDKTGDRDQYFRLWALENLVIRYELI